MFRVNIPVSVSRLLMMVLLAAVAGTSAIVSAAAAKETEAADMVGRCMLTSLKPE